MGLLSDMRLSSFLIPLLQCPIMLYSLEAVCIQGVQGGNVTILGCPSIGQYKQKIVYMHLSYSERFLRKSYFTVQGFGFGAQNCPSFTPYCALLDFVHGVG